MIFETYNPVDAVKRCPNGRSKVRTLLDKYNMESMPIGYGDGANRVIKEMYQNALTQGILTSME